MNNDGDDLCIEKSMPRPDVAAAAAAKSSTSSGEAVVAPPPAGSKMNTVLFIETGKFQAEVSQKAGETGDALSLYSLSTTKINHKGFGCDGHGQDSTKAAVRAARNAIEFNSIPSIRRLVPGGYDNLILHVKVGVPHPERVDAEQVKKVFPYYGACDVEVVAGGLSAGSGIAIASLGDSSDEMVIAVCAVTVGFFDKEKGKVEEGEGGKSDAPKHSGYCE